MNSNKRCATIAIDGVATKYGVEELDRNADTIKDVIDLSVACAHSTFRASKGTRKTGKVPPIINSAPQHESHGYKVMGLVRRGRANESSSLFTNLSI
jgi:hypothetical protein